MIEKPKEIIICFKGAQEICDYIKEDRRDLLFLIESEGLPAWRRKDGGPWRALKPDLDRWLMTQRNKYLKESHQNLKSENPA